MYIKSLLVKCHESGCTLESFEDSLAGQEQYCQEVFLSLCRQLSPAEAAVCQASKGKNEMIFHGHPDLSLINEIMKYLYFSYHITWEWVVGQNKQKGK